MTESSTTPPNADVISEMRAAARSIFDHALAECSITRAFTRELHYADGILRIRGEAYELARFSRLAVVSIGKAGHSMAEAFAQIVAVTLDGIVSCPTAPAQPVQGLRYFTGGHPMPNEESLRAGEAILEMLRGLPADALAVFLISGGASAIAEWPLDQNLTLADIVATNRVLVHSGAPIAEINAIRKHLSAIKGGRMAQAAASAKQMSLLVSDVPDTALDALASGPTMPDGSTVVECYAIAQRYDLLERFPGRVQTIFADHGLQETPKPGDATFSNCRFVTLLSNHTAVNAAVEHAKALTFTVEVDNRCDDWDYAPAADYLLERLRQLRAQSPRVCLISGGEVTVKVGGNSGVGGRNQQFALYCAQQIAGESITVLSAGTDGIDGNSPAAGALVDGTSASRAAAKELSPARVLGEFDAFRLFETIGDTIMTGPTGNNVRDLRVLLAY
jgi:glycerate 2-kinase